jgi:hypothetical protein
MNPLKLSPLALLLCGAVAGLLSPVSATPLPSSDTAPAMQNQLLMAAAEDETSATNEQPAQRKGKQKSKKKSEKGESKAGKRSGNKADRKADKNSARRAFAEQLKQYNKLSAEEKKAYRKRHPKFAAELKKLKQKQKKRKNSTEKSKGAPAKEAPTEQPDDAATT